MQKIGAVILGIMLGLIALVVMFWSLDGIPEPWSGVVFGAPAVLVGGYLVYAEGKHRNPIYYLGLVCLVVGIVLALIPFVS